jgi:hypothetical protein
MAKLKEPKVGDRVTIWADVEAIWPDGTIIIHIPSAKQNVALRDDTGVATVEKVDLPPKRPSD